MIRQIGIRKLPIGEVVVGKRWRRPRASKVEEIRASLRENGLIYPIGVRAAGGSGSWILIYGATRLAAAKVEGWTEIDAQVLEGSSVDMEKAELAENLHRGELTKLQRDRQIARYIELSDENGILRGPRAKKGKGRPQGGVRAAARELRIPEATVRDAMKVKDMTAAVAEVVEELGLADKPLAYKAVAAEPNAEAQMAKARQIATERQQRQTKPQARAGTRLGSLVQAWNSAGKKAQAQFLELIGHSQGKQAIPPSRVRWPFTKANDRSGLKHSLGQGRKHQLDLFMESGAAPKEGSRT